MVDVLLVRGTPGGAGGLGIVKGGKCGCDRYGGYVRGESWECSGCVEDLGIGAELFLIRRNCIRGFWLKRDGRSCRLSGTKSKYIIERIGVGIVRIVN